MPASLLYQEAHPFYFICRPLNYLANIPMTIKLYIQVSLASFPLINFQIDLNNNNNFGFLQLCDTQIRYFLFLNNYATFHEFLSFRTSNIKLTSFMFQRICLKT